MILRNLSIVKMAFAVTLLLVGVAANATLYTYSVDNPPGSEGAGDITHVTTTYWSDTCGE